jgi:thiamine-monophosphate kinase
MSILQDLGERQILRTIIPRFTQGAGDDCAIIPLRDGKLIITTDPVPPPAAKVIGGDADAYWMGWLLVTINVSDLAAAGAQPLAFVAAAEAEPTMPTVEFERLLLGIKDACDESGLAYVGGNIREARTLAAVGTAVGICTGYEPLTRTGAHVDDIVVSVGAGGCFWRDALRTMTGKLIRDKNASHLFRPLSQIRFMHEFARSKVISAAMDNSDGLLPTLSELAAKNQCSIQIDVSQLQIPELTAEEKRDAPRLWMGWGDWNVIACVLPDKFDELNSIAKRLSAEVIPIGKVVAGAPVVMLQNGSSAIVAPRLESERFAKDSWMLKGGVDEYARLLRNLPLP